jgi:hypothetical protein
MVGCTDEHLKLMEGENLRDDDGVLQDYYN